MQMKKTCIIKKHVLKKTARLKNEDEKNSIVKNLALDDVDEKTCIYYKNIALDDVDEKNMYNKKHCT